MKEYSMTITALPSGKFKYTQKYLDPYASKPGSLKYKSVSCTLAKKTKQAQAHARAILSEKIELALGNLGTSNITLRTLFKHYCEHYNLNKDKAELDPSYQTYWVYQTHIKEYINSLNDLDPIISNLDVPFFKEYFDRMQQKYSHSYCNIRRAALLHLFTYGIEFGYIKTNPILGLRLKRHRIDAVKLIENKYLTDKEYKDLIDYVKKAGKINYADLFETMYLTGLRFSEISGLQVKDFKKIDGKYSLIINGILVKKHKSNNQAIKRKATKTNAGMRVVYLPPKASEIVKKHCINKNDNQFIFTNKKMPLVYTSTNQYLKRAAKKAGINKNITTHFFRHTHISKLASLGVPLEDIKKRVGHESAKTTEQIYYHMLSESKDKLETIVDKL
ncbi:tyrosine-type recombinase/integrase [Lactobacillus pasteurii]|uniref:Integrase n=1 Tax=Lactobacillus pasteurii DSM 23907 = CRBIP 24.76 TaxID=1423790 RepID=I7LDY8_9LACO|nr:site-specific integrase [Lactobacillus pasteurii]TDG76584.1 hypothetical protein C5L33_001343 [Lactobacillus pasteurii]CCI85323.1 Integrase [Lactobacillus pasteurii DSM 23907 = CRBIP 24.76]